MTAPLFDRPVRLDREVSPGDLHLAVHDWPGRRGPILCLPDLAASGRSLDALAAALAPEWRVLALDPRGRGGSARPAFGYGYQVHAADAAGLVEVFGFERVVLLGHGYGALVALVLAAWELVPVAGLVLLDGPGLPSDAETSPAAGEPPAAPWAVEQDRRAHRDGPPDLAALAREAVCPTLVVRTADAGGDAALRAALPSAREVVLAGATHASLVANTAAAVDAFLASLA